MIVLDYHDNLNNMFTRSLFKKALPSDSFFLWGPRQSGKSTLLREKYPHALWIDLLNTKNFLKYKEKPYLLREEIMATKNVTHVIIDEVQKAPLLLDEVHSLIESTNIIFGLCGSSARKIKRGHANLLGGRALRYELFGLTALEIGEKFDITRILNHGYLPKHYIENNYKHRGNSYIEDYLKEEIFAEGLTRNLPAFSHFLRTVSFTDTEIIKYSNIARECGVSEPTVKEYFQILFDTLLARTLPSFRGRNKRRAIQAPKFYYSDIGIINILSKRSNLSQGTPEFGKAFENWVFHELCAYNLYFHRFAEISYWRLASGIEVDFIINDCEVAIEAKSSQQINDGHLKGLRELIKEHTVKKAMVVSLDEKRRVTNDGILILPYSEFTSELCIGTLF